MFQIAKLPYIVRFVDIDEIELFVINLETAKIDNYSAVITCVNRWNLFLWIVLFCILPQVQNSNLSMSNATCNPDIKPLFSEENKFEDIKEAIRSNGQKKRTKGQSTIYKTFSCSTYGRLCYSFYKTGDEEKIGL